MTKEIIEATLKRLEEKLPKAFPSKKDVKNFVLDEMRIAISSTQEERDRSWREKLNLLDTCLEGLRVSDPMGYGNQKFEANDVVERLKETKEKILSDTKTNKK